MGHGPAEAGQQRRALSAGVRIARQQQVPTSLACLPAPPLPPVQPFRGWGHTWPGHFLPTDAVHHWSRREQEGFPVLAGADFPAIAPPLPELGSAGGGAEAGHAAGLQGCGAIKPPPAALAPPLQGWQWCEDKWHLDLSGQIIDACDEEGWSYGALPDGRTAEGCLRWLLACKARLPCLVTRAASCLCPIASPRLPVRAAPLSAQQRAQEDGRLCAAPPLDPHARAARAGRLSRAPPPSLLTAAAGQTRLRCW